MKNLSRSCSTTTETRLRTKSNGNLIDFLVTRRCPFPCGQGLLRQGDFSAQFHNNCSSKSKKELFRHLCLLNQHAAQVICDFPLRFLFYLCIKRSCCRSFQWRARCLTITPFLDMFTAPLERFIVMIIGKSSGVNPTARAAANSSDSINPR